MRFFFSLGKSALVVAKPKSAPILTKRQQAIQAVGKAWRQVVSLNHGDNLRSAFLRDESASSSSSGSIHKNTWNFDGIYRETWCQVGAKGCRRRGDVSHTHHELVLLCAFARAAQIAQGAAIKEQITDPILRGDNKSLFVALHHDGTPVSVHFGALKSVLEADARYLVKTEEGKWITVAYDDYIKINGRAATTSSGIVEIFAYSAEAYWNHGSEQRKIIASPVILSKGNASVSYGAVNDMIDGLSLDSIITLCAELVCMLLSEKPDAVKYIKRMMMHKALLLPRNCFYISDSCSVHRIHRITELATREGQHCGDTYSVGFVSKNLHKKQEIDKAKDRLVDEELIVIHAEPHEHNLQHTSNVLDHTIARSEGIIRGRAGGAEEKTPVQRHKHVVEQRSLILAFLNGDIRANRIVHYENNCCTDGNGIFDMSICKTNVKNAISTAGLLCDKVQGDASKNRWGSCQDHDAAQTAGEMIHQIHPRSCARAFDTWQAGDIPEGTDDFRRFVQGKVWRTVKVTSHEDYGWTKALRLWGLEGIDHLWRQLEFMDESGSSIFDITFEKTNPIIAARTKLATIVLQPVLEGPLRTVFHHWEDVSAAATIDMTTYTRKLICSVDSHVGERTREWV